MTNTELPSIQHLLSSLEGPLRTPRYVLPALVLPNKHNDHGHFSSPLQRPAATDSASASASASALAAAAAVTAAASPPQLSQLHQQTPRQQPQLPPVKLESPARSSPGLRGASPAGSRSSISSSELNAPAHCSCKSHRRNSAHIPRPRNAFILFRQHFHYELFPKNESMLSTLGSFKTNSEISREIGQRWRGLPPKEKQYWHDLAQQEKERHRLMYPDYKYIPRKMEMDSHQYEYCVKRRGRS